MFASKRKTINNKIVEEYYWAGKLCTYVDNLIQPNETFEEVVQRLEKDLLDEQQDSLWKAVHGD